MTAFVSLFRGINVGGHAQVSMAKLKALHESLGLQDVSSYIQSGNVVFTGDAADAAQLQQHIEAGFATTFGFHSAVILRTVADLDAIIANNPFQGQPDKEANRLHVMLLAARPDEAAQEGLLKTYAGPEEIFFSGQEVYLYYPDGMGRSKLTNNFIEKKLKTVGTARNWNTVLQLQQLLQRL